MAPARLLVLFSGKRCFMDSRLAPSKAACIPSHQPDSYNKWQTGWASASQTALHTAPPSLLWGWQGLHASCSGACGCLQKSGGTLPEAAARSTLIGVGPPLPPPTLAGLQQPPTAPPGPTSWSNQPQVLHAAFAYVHVLLRSRTVLRLHCIIPLTSRALPCPISLQAFIYSATV